MGGLGEDRGHLRQLPRDAVDDPVQLAPLGHADREPCAGVPSVMDLDALLWAIVAANARLAVSDGLKSGDRTRSCPWLPDRGG